MILGIGCDIIEVVRVDKLIRSYGAHFLDRLFSSQEQSYCNSQRQAAQHYAGRFAAKEAIAKALGTGFGAHLSWRDLEVLKDAQGKPIVLLSSKANSRFDAPHILLSISHCTEYATAFAIWQRTAT